jgi:hypothetical protein
VFFCFHLKTALGLRCINQSFLNTLKGSNAKAQKTS